MKLEFKLGETEITVLTIERNWFTGKFTYSANGAQNEIRNPLNPSTHFNLKLTQNYAFEVGNNEKHKIELIHKRPLLFAGFRPQKFEVRVNGK